MIINTLYEYSQWHAENTKRPYQDVNKMLLRWREEEDGQWARKEKVVDDYEPYCYVPLKGDLLLSAYDETSTRILPNSLCEHKNSKHKVERLEPTDKLTADGRQLIKVILKKPSDLRWFGKNVKPSFEADVP